MSEPPEDGRWAARRLAETLLQDEELSVFYRDAVHELDTRTFHRRHFKILAEYFYVLRDASQSPGHDQVLSVLSAGPQRLLLSGWIERLSEGRAGGPAGKASSPHASLGIDLFHLRMLVGDTVPPGTADSSSRVAEGSAMLQELSLSSLSEEDEGIQDEVLKVVKDKGLRGDLPRVVEKKRFRDEVPKVVGKKGLRDELPIVVADEAGPPLSQGDSRTFIEMLEGGVFEKSTAFKLLRKQVRYLPLGKSRQRRQTDIKRLEDFFRGHFGGAAMGGDDWIKDLRKLGYSHKEIARLLCGSKFDSPWIYYEPPAGMTPMRVTPLEHHRPFCSYMLLPSGYKAATEPWERYSPPPGISEDKNRIIEHFLGLGGASPLLVDDEESTVEFKDRNTKALVTLSKLAVNRGSFTQRVRRLFTGLGHAQEAGLYCCCFTLLTRSGAAHGNDSNIRLVTLTLAEVTQFLDFLAASPGRLQPDTRSLVKCIFPDAILPDEKFEGVDAFMHWASLILQVLSTGFLSYKQAHMGALRPFFLDTPVDEILLLGTDGAGDSNVPSVKAQLVELSCFSEVTRGPVLVFSLSWAGGTHWSPHPAKTFNICGTPEAILDTWGPGGLVLHSDEPGPYVALKIGPGYIYPSNSPSKPTMYHFGPELKLSEESPALSPGVEIVVGNPVQENDTCQNTEEDCWAYASRNHLLEDIRAHDPFWKLHQRQLALQGGYQVIVQGVFTQEKKPGTPVKDSVLFSVGADMHMAQGQLVAFLDRHYGLRVSYCTGIAQRVPLRQVVADLLPGAARSLTAGSRWKLWLVLSEIHEAIQKFRDASNRLREWLLDLPDNLRELVHELVGSVLGALRHTGVDVAGNYFNILWVHDGTLASGLKVPIDGVNRWITMLADTKDTATFAYITHTCLECNPITCRGQDPSWGDEIRLLDTAVYERGSRRTAILEPEQVYYFAVDATTVWFQARRAAAPAHPSELVCLSYTASIPQKIIARLIVWEWEGRKKRMLAENHMAAGASIRVKIRPPD